MANEKTKKKVQVWMEPDLVAQIDGIAARDGMTRAGVLTAAAKLYVSGAKETPAEAKLDAVMSKLDAIVSAQGELKAQQLAQATVIVDAVKNQPIAVQQLPAAEPAESELALADVRAYLEDRYPGRFVFNMFDEPEPAPRKGLAARIFGRK